MSSPTRSEQKILDYIATHPGKRSLDIGAALYGTQDAHNVIKVHICALRKKGFNITGHRYNGYHLVLEVA